MADLISVVIPVYNTNERFQACFESVLNQKYQNIEILLVDDGSSDTSAHICDMVAMSTSSFPVFVIHKPNGGVSRARNLGIDFANGKYLVFIDSDDQVTPDYVSDFMEAKEKYPDVGHIWCGFEHCAQEKTQYVYSEIEEFSFLSRNDYLRLYEKVMTQGPCQRIYDVSVLKRNNIKMIETLSLAEDIIFNLEYLDAVSVTSICVLNKPNYLYLDADDGSLKNQYRDNLFEIYEFYLRIMKQYLVKWNAFDDLSDIKFCNTVYYECSFVMNSVFSSNKGFLEKIKKCNSILNSDIFIDALNKTDINISSYLKRAYETKNYFWVLVVNKLSSLYRRNL